MKHFLYLSLCLLAVPLQGAKKVILMSLEDQNKEADRAFIAWKLDTPHSAVSPELRKVLTPEAREFLVNESQLTFAEYLNKEQLKQKVRQLSKDFTEKFKIAQYPWADKRELQKLIEAIVSPEYEFQIDPTALDPLDKTYNELFQTLSLYKTPSGTFLNEWALRFLTSESVFIALSILRRETIGGKLFNDLSDAEQVHLLSFLGEVITRRFMNNLQAVQKAYGFTEPSNAEMAVKKRVSQFLLEKFGL